METLGTSLPGENLRSITDASGVTLKRKKRIIFVDDESYVLQGLQRMLRGMREEWDMQFVEGGYAALERMNQEPYDVIVSDMQMPGMNGAELLNEVMRRHPRTVRFVISGHANRGLILRCVGSTHQYLAKPCDAEVLKYAVARATLLDSIITTEELKELVGRIETLPSLPSLYTEIIKCLQSPQVSMDEIGAVIEQDIAMTAKLLKIVNSAFFGLAREISRPAEAVSYLGADVLKALVFSAQMFARHEADHGSSLFLEKLWKHSLNVGLAAKALAREEGVSEIVVNEAFVSGLLHDVGKLVLAGNFPREYRRVISKTEVSGCTSIEAEREIFGTTHTEVGGYLLGLWGLPVSIVEAVTLHHSPEASLRPSFSALTAVHVANTLLRPTSEVAALDERLVESQGWADREPVWKDIVRDRLAGLE